MSAKPCHCGSGRNREDCCGPCLDGTTPAPTALACMRSRYSAYCEAATPYLLATWHPDNRPAQLILDDKIRWIGLKIIRVEAGGVGDPTGLVEFTARYRRDGRGARLHEISRFVADAGRWFYVDPD